MTTMRVDQIDASGRHRTDLGDVRALAESIERVGLLHPIVVTSSGRLVAGGRRLAAFAALGRDEIPVTIADSLADARTQLQAERDENICRLDMKPSEKVALGRALEELERPKAAERKAEGRPNGNIGKVSPSSRGERTGKVYDLVGEAVGMSGRTYQRAKAVVQAAEDDEPGGVEALEKMDRTGKVSGAYESMPGVGRKRVVAPASLDTERGQQAAAAHLRRYVELVSRIEGLAASVDSINPEYLHATCDAQELAQLRNQLNKSLAVVRKFNRSI